MRQLSTILAALLFAAGCQRDRPDAAGNASASAYTSASDSIAREDGVAGTNSGTELEAPRLIPAVRNQIDLMSRGTVVNEDNLTAYKNLAGDVINSMVADLYRVGHADTGGFKALQDSILNDLGGGAGTDSDLKQSELPQHAARMRRLLDMHQRTMRGAADRL